MKSHFNLFFICFLILISSCSNKEYFEIVSVSDNDNNLNSFKGFSFYINEKDIEQDFFEIAVLKTDLDYVGNFFFDEDFMQKLKDKVKSISADGAIYDTTMLYSDKKENYFIAIKFTE